MIRLSETPVVMKDMQRPVAAGPEKKNLKEGSIAYQILKKHNTSNNMDKLALRFDKLTSHDITYVGIIQTARASGLEKFPMPYVLTNCHNSLCAVGGTINEDDHVFGLTCAQKYGGVYVPPHQAVIHQFAREMMAEAGSMILGSDSHTRYGALGCMAVGEGGPELVKQLLDKTYDVDLPDIICVYLTGKPEKGVGPQDVALSLVGATFGNGYVKNKVLEFVGPGVENLSVDFRIGIDVMTTETTCLSSVWQTDLQVKDYYAIHGRGEAYKELKPAKEVYYDGCVEIDLSQIKPVIAMPFHPSNVYTIEEVNANPEDILAEVEKNAAVSLEGAVDYSLRDKIRNGKLYVEQGIIAGCAGGGFENICAAADILRGREIGNGEFTLSVYPASMPIYMELIKNGVAADILSTGAVLKTAFCGPCFGAGDTPANNAFSIRHSTRNFPNREGSKPQSGQIASVALMDARSIAATAANKGFLTAATDFDIDYTKHNYYFDKTIYDNRVYDSKGIADPSVEIKFGPNIKDWPKMENLKKDILLKVVSVIHDPVTTTDELIPSGETSSYRSNPEGLAEFALSRKDPAYVGEAKKVRAAENARVQASNQTDKLPENEKDPDEVLLESEKDPKEVILESETLLEEVLPEFKAVKEIISKHFTLERDNFCIGSTIYAVKPGDGSAREQAASCQKVLGGWANIAKEYATKRYRSNLINWGMIPFIWPDEELPFDKENWIFVPDVAEKIAAGETSFEAFVVDPENKENNFKQITLKMDPLTEDEKTIVQKGCLINYYRA